MTATETTRSWRAFIVRPFGTKAGIDFDRVERELISPALERLGILGRTTLDILRTGNIRTDMFQSLLVADVVIADLSIHNANVFYELGLRHALRRAATVLIRGREGGDKIPFDLFTDRYFAYDEKDPASSVDELVQVLYDTIHSTECDSPVFQLLPEMVEQKAESFLSTPPSFLADVARAQEQNRPGDLALYAEEIREMPWARVGLRAIGRAQFALRAMKAAKETWEAVLRLDDDDLAANEVLATIYQKLGNLGDSDLCIDRVLEHPEISRTQRAEGWGLKGRNAKTRWVAEWLHETDRERARKRALASGWLRQSFEAYAKGFTTDMTNLFPGINALGLAVILVELANADLRTWRDSHDTDKEADRELEELTERRQALTVTVAESINAAQELARDAGEQNLWADISEADLSLYRGDSPSRVRGRYNLVRGISPFQVGAVRTQLELFLRLGIYEEAARAALETLPEAKSEPERPHVLLFTGHRLDDPGRTPPRFPAAKVETARQEIAAAIDDAVARHQGRRLTGISGAASGGDILFHEECLARGIETTIYLPLPEREYAAKSVNSAGGEWTRRYNDLLRKTQTRILQSSPDLPDWLAQRHNEYKVWERSNLWMLHNALHEGTGVTLIALWNGQPGDGPGGTADMVAQIEQRGGEVVRVGVGTVFEGR